jgi:arabinose-5-phosphate isomerase
MNPLQTSDALTLGRRVLEIEAEAIRALAPRIDGAFSAACDLLLGCRGRVVVSGMGKSGHIGRKIAATFASTGTPAFFVHPAEALHGDLGMVTGDDVFVAISYSGSAQELVTIMPILKRSGAKLIAVTGNPASELAELADVHLNVFVEREACPMNLAPTASTTATLAMGDALAVAVLSARGFGKEDFARSHPGGALGRRLLTHVYDVMRTGSAIPVVNVGASVTEALLEISRKGIGCTAILDGKALAGIFTDGNLRRLLEKGADIRDMKIADVMTRTPITIEPDALAAEAAEVMDRTRRMALLVVADGQLRGVVHVNDLMQAKVI